MGHRSEHPKKLFGGQVGLSKNRSQRSRWYVAVAVNRDHDEPASRLSQVVVTTSNVREPIAVTGERSDQFPSGDGQAGTSMLVISGSCSGPGIAIPSFFAASI